MKIQKRIRVHESFVLALHVGDKIQESLVSFCKEQGIRAASYSGIGAVRNVEIGQYDGNIKSYRTKSFTKTYELSSLTGNIALAHQDDGREELFAHTHVTFTDEEFRVYGGHLFEAEVYAVAELFIHCFEGDLHRRMDEVTGLRILSKA